MGVFVCFVNGSENASIFVKRSKGVKQLQSRLSDIETLIASNAQQTTKLINLTKSSENKMKSTFTLFENKLQERKTMLNMQLHEQNDAVLNSLQQTQKKLSGYICAIKNAQKQQQLYLMDRKLEATKREIKLEQILNNTLKDVITDDIKFDVMNDFTSSKLFTVDLAQICQVMYVSVCVICRTQ